MKRLVEPAFKVPCLAFFWGEGKGCGATRRWIGGQQQQQQQQQQKKVEVMTKGRQCTSWCGEYPLFSQRFIDITSGAGFFHQPPVWSFTLLRMDGWEDDPFLLRRSQTSGKNSLLNMLNTRFLGWPLYGPLVFNWSTECHHSDVSGKCHRVFSSLQGSYGFYPANRHTWQTCIPVYVSIYIHTVTYIWYVHNLIDVLCLSISECSSPTLSVFFFSTSIQFPAAVDVDDISQWFDESTALWTHISPSQNHLKDDCWW